MDITQLLAFSVKNKASDLHLSAGLPPMIRVHGDVRRLNVDALDHKTVHAMVYDIMNDTQRKTYEEFLEIDFSFEIEGLARFRVNAFNHQRGAGAVLRTIPSKILTLEQLNAPKIFGDLALKPRGLVLVTGPTGSGKSTTLAAMVNYLNETEYAHVLTVEDPIEFVHTHRKSLVNQREVGIDTLSFDDALRHAMREAPDVIMIGEIRDRLTMQHAMAYADTGHLCMSTLHANSANQAVQRVIHFFPQDVRHQVLLDLSLNLRAVIGQRLITNVEGRLVPALEVMQVTPYIADLILKGQIDEIKTVMHKGRDQGMCTFDDSLFNLYEAGQITREQAIDYADSKTDVSVRIRLTGGEPEVS